MNEIKFEVALKRLEEIADKLERGDIPLEDSLKLYEEGQKLIKLCREKLSKAEAKVKELIKKNKEFILKPTERDFDSKNHTMHKNEAT
ncbi:MAG TPA: exodeoxyribonuclease VII small subunit [bacterium (Candidatus Stahlbacteria)]|nr:exodeoxyribonuclease VII small subunit [Candidatus Stahlbacteria bacterium]